MFARTTRRHAARRLAPAVLLAGAAALRAAAPPALPLSPSLTPTSTPSRAEVLARWVETARAKGSEALVLLQDGEVLVEETFGFPDEPIFAMSVTKSVTAMGAALLQDEGKLDIDRPLSQIFPTWDDRDLTPVTTRHLLEHTSGLSTERSHTTGLGLLAHANQSPRDAAPGERFLYNNNACDLLGVVVGQLAGEPLDAFLQRRLFTPLGITQVGWARDAEGYPKAAGELRIRAADLAKLGQLMLQGGTWQGQALLSPEAHARLTTAHPERAYIGHLWWILQDQAWSVTPELIASWQSKGLPDAAAAELATLYGRTFAGRDPYLAALQALEAWPDIVRLDPLFRTGELDFTVVVPEGEPAGYSGRGWLGQHLVVLPEHRLVGVRMRRYRDQDGQGPPWDDVWESFEPDLRQLAADLAASPTP